MRTNIPSAPKYQYRRRLPHFQKSDAPLFVTFCTGGPFVLPENARDLILQHCLRDHGVSIDLLAAVVMPDHVHLLLRALRNADGWSIQLVEIMQRLKSATAHRINKLLHRSGPVWEEESSIMFCGLMKVWRRSASISGRIR